MAVATYRAVMLTRKDGPEGLRIVELPIEPPGPGQLRVRVLTGAAGGRRYGRAATIKAGGREDLRCGVGAEAWRLALTRRNPIDYRAGPIDRLTRALEPKGVDYVFDAVGGANIGPCISALRRGGTLAAASAAITSGFLQTPSSKAPRPQRQLLRRRFAPGRFR